MEIKTNIPWSQTEGTEEAEGPKEKKREALISENEIVQRYGKGNKRTYLDHKTEKIGGPRERKKGTDTYRNFPVYYFSNKFF